MPARPPSKAGKTRLGVLARGKLTAFNVEDMGPGPIAAIRATDPTVIPLVVGRGEEESWEAIGETSC